MSCRKTSLNSYFTNLEEDVPNLIRNALCAMVLSQPEVEETHGFKLQFFTLLGEVISTAEVCSGRRNPDSRLLLF